MTDLLQRPLVEGPLAIDLLNTSWHDGVAPVDWLVSDDAVALLHAEHGLGIDPDQIATARLNLVRARDVIRRLLSGSSPALDALADANELLADARITLGFDGDGFVRSTASDTPATRLAVDAVLGAASLLEHQPDRIRQCAHEQCVLWFADISKGGRRRWCSMATCGNRSKANRHYQRSRSTKDHGV